MSIFELLSYPQVDYPTVVRGQIYGPIRCESLDGSELFLPNDGMVELRNFTPFKKDGRIYAVTHLQKRSKKGSLTMSPWIYHWWDFQKLQEQDIDGNWVPGTERGIYLRTPGWRWDVAGTQGKHWIRSGGFIGGHLD